MKNSYTPDHMITDLGYLSREQFRVKQKTSFQDLDYKTTLFEESFNDVDRGKDFNCFRNVLANLSDNLQRVRIQNKTQSNYFTSFYDGPSKQEEFFRASSVYKKHRTDSSGPQHSLKNLPTSQTGSQDNFNSSSNNLRKTKLIQESHSRKITPSTPEADALATANATSEQINQIKVSYFVYNLSGQPQKNLASSAEQGPVRSWNGFRNGEVHKFRESNDSTPIRSAWTPVKPETTYRELSITHVEPPFTDVTPRLVTNSRKKERLPHRPLDLRARMTMKLGKSSQKLNKESHKSNDNTPRQFINYEDFQEMFGKPSKQSQNNQNFTDSRRSLTTNLESDRKDRKNGERESKPSKPTILEQGYNAQELTKLRPDEVIDRIDKLMKQGKLASLKDKQAFIIHRPTVHQISALDNSDNRANLNIIKTKSKIKENKFQQNNPGSQRILPNDTTPKLNAKKLKFFSYSNRASPQRNNMKVDFGLIDRQPANSRSHTSAWKLRK